MAENKPAAKARDFAINLVLQGVMGAMLLIPYRWRVPLFGALTARLIAPLAGYSKRIRANLAHVCPDLPEAEVRRLMRAVPDNTGRSLIEIYSGRKFIDRVRALPLEGPGAKALQQAHEAGRPVVLVTGHFGNYDAPRAALIARGYRVGGVYMPMKNRYFNAHYERAIAGIGTPLFARGRKGLAKMLRFLKTGGMVGLVADQYMNRGAPLTFFGKPAPTALSAAEMALKYNALLVPIYGVRQPDGLSFRLFVDAPVAPSDALTMTQALNDSLEAAVRSNMEQWFWIHRRWKPERQRARAAARTGP